MYKRPSDDYLKDYYESIISRLKKSDSPIIYSVKTEIGLASITYTHERFLTKPSGIGEIIFITSVTDEIEKYENLIKKLNSTN